MSVLPNPENHDPTQEALHPGAAQAPAAESAPPVEAHPGETAPPPGGVENVSTAGTSPPTRRGPDAPPLPPGSGTRGATNRQQKDKQGVKPLSVRAVPVRCHDTVQTVKEHYITNTFKQERKRASEVVEDSDREWNYLRSLLTLVSFIHKFVISNFIARLIAVAHEDTKGEDDWVNEHKDLVLKAIAESNLPGYIIPHLEKQRRINGSSPTYDAFEKTIPKMCSDLISDTLPVLEDDGYFEPEEVWNEEMIKKWVNDKVKNKWRAKIIDFIYEICDAKILTTMDDTLPTLDSINLEVHLLKNTIKDLQISASADIEEKKFLASEIARVQQDSMTAAFLEEERKIRVEPMDQMLWKDAQKNPISDDAKKAPIQALLQEWYGAEAASKVDFFVAKENRRSPPWMKLTFQNMHDKFNFESRLKSHREEKKAAGIKTYFSSRLTPMEFAPTKKKLADAAVNKAAGDWIIFVSRCNLEDTWNTDLEYVKRAISVRLKYKVAPRFSAWMEVLDPCHRSMWRAIEFDTNINHFEQYDLRHKIPCPDTRAKAATDRNYGKVRNGPRDTGKDLRNPRTPGQRPLIRSADERRSFSVKETVRNLERGTFSARRDLRDIMDNEDVPGLNPEDPLFNVTLQERTGETIPEVVTVDPPAQEEEENPEGLEDSSSQASGESRDTPVAKRKKEGATPYIRPRRTRGNRGHL